MKSLSAVFYQLPQPVAYLWQRTPISYTTIPTCQQDFQCHSLCWQVTSVSADCCGNHRTSAFWTEVTAIFVQINTEERCPTAAVLSDLLLAIVFRSYRCTSTVTKLVILDAISVLFSSIYTTSKTVSKQIRRSWCVLHLIFCTDFFVR
jgi:hypothetical protein